MAGRALRPGTRRLARIDSRAAAVHRAAAAARGDCAVSTAVVPRSLLPRRVDRQLRSLERARESDRDPITGLHETVDAIWKVVEQAASEPALDVSRHEGSALLARRELVQRGAYVLSALHQLDRKSTRLNSSHLVISYAVFCLKKNKRTPM